MRPGIAAIVCVLLSISGSRTLRAAPGDVVPPEDLVIVTDDTAPRDGPSQHSCDEILVVSSQTGRPFGWSHWHMSPGRLATTSDAGVILSVLNNSSYERGRGGWVRVMLRQQGEPLRWTSRDVPISVPDGGPVAISPDDETVLFGLRSQAVEKHRVADITLSSLGLPTGTFAGVVAAEIEFSPDSGTAYVIDTDGEVFVIDVATMQPIGEPIPYEAVTVSHDWRLRNTFASVSPDGRYLA